METEEWTRKIKKEICFNIVTLQIIKLLLLLLLLLLNIPKLKYLWLPSLHFLFFVFAFMEP